jgi:hypothetical protein
LPERPILEVDAVIKLPLVDRLKFLIERQFVKGAGFQLLVVAAGIGLITMIGGLAAAQEPAGVC